MSGYKMETLCLYIVWSYGDKGMELFDFNGNPVYDVIGNQVFVLMTCIITAVRVIPKVPSMPSM